MEISARNQIPGHVKDLKIGKVMGEVEVSIDSAVITAAITAASIDRLALKPGDRVTVIVKATEILIGK
jgi:molybdopterin-binding protein